MKSIKILVLLLWSITVVADSENWTLPMAEVITGGYPLPGIFLLNNSGRGTWIGQAAIQDGQKDRHFMRIRFMDSDGGLFFVQDILPENPERQLAPLQAMLLPDFGYLVAAVEWQQGNLWEVVLFRFDYWRKVVWKARIPAPLYQSFPVFLVPMEGGYLLGVHGAKVAGGLGPYSLDRLVKVDEKGQIAWNNPSSLTLDHSSAAALKNGTVVVARNVVQKGKIDFSILNPTGQLTPKFELKINSYQIALRGATPLSIDEGAKTITLAIGSVFPEGRTFRSGFVKVDYSGNWVWQNWKSSNSQISRVTFARLSSGSYLTLEEGRSRASSSLISSGGKTLSTSLIELPSDPAHKYYYSSNAGNIVQGKTGEVYYTLATSRFDARSPSVAYVRRIGSIVE